MSDHDDFAVEPVPGLPEQLPDGEHIVWQGAPDWRELAVRAFHVRAVLVYFGALMIWRAAVMLDRGADAGATAQSVLALLPPALIATGLLLLVAWMSARATLYTITNRRVAMRIGVALTKTINIPFRVIAGASVANGSGRRGDVALELEKDTRIAFLHLWPHARPWHVNRPQPAFRAIPEVANVAATLKAAMQAWQAETGAAVSIAAGPAPAPEAGKGFLMGGTAGAAA